MKDYVLYWMQQAQRADYNKALNKAIEIANNLNKELKVIFCLTDNFKDANLRSYHFMLQGLIETKNRLTDKGCSFEIVIGSIPKSLIPYIKNACEVICDIGYLKFQIKWRSQIKKICSEYDKPCHLIETDLIIPIEEASNKQEYMAWTFRKKVADKIEDYLVPLKNNELDIKSKNENDESINIDEMLSKLTIDNSVNPSKRFSGGYTKAKEYSTEFISNKLINYSESNDPSKEYTSLLSPYLHFGQISALEIALEMKKIKTNTTDNKLIESIDQFLEQLIIRRELAFNYVYYNKDYDLFEGITSDWAYKTMKEHKSDVREYIYSLDELEFSKTHDEYWNAAMNEMRSTGYMHGYMRMYWCKKIIEWSPDYKTAYENSIYLNNKYFLDGRDANSYTGVAWCFGLHDRAWQERKIFGKLRYMNKNGLDRKFDMQKYMQKVN